MLAVMICSGSHKAMLLKAASTYSSTWLMDGGICGKGPLLTLHQGQNCALDVCKATAQHVVDYIPETSSGQRVL